MKGYEKRLFCPGKSIFRETFAKKVFAVCALNFVIAVLPGCHLMGNRDETVSVDESVSGNLAASEDSTKAYSENSKQHEAVNTIEIELLFGDTEVTAILDDSATSKVFVDMLPMTLDMRRYANREYYATIDALPEDGECIPDFENGDITYFTTGKSLAVFFGNAENSSQSDLIRMGRITSDLILFEKMSDSETVTIMAVESEDTMRNYDFSSFGNVEITGIDVNSLSDDELAVLYAQAKYCQAMTDADIGTMRELVSEDMIFTHMSGMTQSREEYFADVADGSLNYFTIGIANPVIKVNGNTATIAYTSVLNANAYGARGTYHMKGTHHYEKHDGEWIAVNGS